MREALVAGARGSRIAPLATLAIAALTSRCTTPQGNVDDILVVSQVEVTPASASVRIGAALQLTVTPKTSSSIVLFGRNVTWSSSNPELATVSATGLVQALAEGGPVRITALVDGVAGESMVTVLALPVARVTVAPSQATLAVGTSTQLSAAAYDEAGYVMPRVTFTWQSSNPVIVDVTTTGIVLAISEGGPVTISATADAVSGSASITVYQPAPIAPEPTKLGFIQEPGPATARQPLTPAVKVAIQDEQGGTVSSSSARVTIGLGNNPGAANLTGTLTVDAVNGVATFSDLVIDRGGTGYTLVASAPGLAATSSAPFDVATPAPPSLIISAQPSSSAQSGVMFSQQPIIALRTGAGQPVSGALVTAAIESGGGNLGGTTTVTSDANGMASYPNLSISGSPGTRTLRFDASGFPTAVSNPIALSSGPASQLSFTQQPGSSATSGQAFAQQPILVLEDAANNPVSGQVVTAMVTGSPAGVSLIGATSVITDAYGVASFVGTGLGLSGPTGTYTLAFRSGTVTSSVSTPISLSAGAPARLNYTQQPGSSATSGQAFTQQPILVLQDAASNPVSGQVVTATVTGSPAGVTFIGAASVTTDASGVASFLGTGMGLSGPTGTYTLTFRSGTVTSSASTPITLSTGAPAQVSYTQQPGSSAQSGQAFSQQPILLVKDGANNPVSGQVVTATITGSPAGASLVGATSATTDASGTASFVGSGLGISGPAGNYTLTFQTGPASSAASNPIALNPGAASQLTITVQPSSVAVRNVPFPQQPVIQLLDGAGNPVNQAGVPVTASIASGPSNATLGGTTTILTDGSGTASFTNLKINRSGTFTLVFRSGTLQPVVSDTITIP